MSNKKLLNFSELAEYLGMSRNKLQDLIDEEKFTVKPIVDYSNKKPKLWSIEQVKEWLKNG